MVADWTPDQRVRFAIADIQGLRDQLSDAELEAMVRALERAVEQARAAVGRGQARVVPLTTAPTLGPQPFPVHTTAGGIP